MQHQIARAQADVKFYAACLAVLEADQAYRNILRDQGIPYKDVSDRVLLLSAALHALQGPAEPEPCRHCGTRPTANVVIVTDHDGSELLHYPILPNGGAANVLAPGFITGAEDRDRIRKALREALNFLGPDERTRAQVALETRDFTHVSFESLLPRDASDPTATVKQYVAAPEVKRSHSG